jgi:putative PEP-CTERM system TPR-repeat lipoprotein
LQQIAALHVRKKEFDAAIDALRRAKRVAPDDRNLSANVVATYAGAGKFDDALKEAKALQDKEPKQPGGYALEGDVYSAQKSWSEAERAYREALKREPRAGALAAKVHAVLEAAGKSGEADAFGRKWTADNAKDVPMRMYLAERALNKKDHKEAFGLYQQVIVLEPNNAIALNNLAWVAGEHGDARAIGYAERSVALVPNAAASLDTLGTLLVNKGDAKKGLEYLERARSLAPDAPVLRLNYAKALAKVGRKDEARKEFEALKGIAAPFPGKDEIDGNLKAL